MSRTTRWILPLSFAGIVALLTLSGGTGRRFALIESLSFSRDGSQIAVVRIDARDPQTPGKLYKAGLSRVISTLDARGGKLLSVVHKDYESRNRGAAFRFWRRGRTSAVFNPLNDSIVATAFGGGDILRLVPSDDAPPSVTAMDAPACNLAISRSGRLIAASGDYRLTVLDAGSSRVVMQADVEDAPFLHASMIAFTQDERRLVVASLGKVSVWNLETRTEASTILAQWDPSPRSLAIAAADTVLVHTNEWVKRYDFDGNLVGALSESGEHSACVTSPDGGTAAICCNETLQVYDVAGGKPKHSLPLGWVSAAAFSPDGQSLAVGHSQNQVSMIDVATGEQRWRCTPPGASSWPWTYPAFLLVVWCVAAWNMLRRRRQVDEY